jgi:hypothetical protein
MSPLRKNTSSTVSHPDSKGTPSPSTSLPFILSAIKLERSVFCLGQPPLEKEQQIGKNRLLPRPIASGGKKQGKILFKGSNSRPPAGFRRTASGLQSSEPNTDQGFEGWPLERAPKPPQSIESGMTIGTPVHGPSSGCDLRYLQTYPTPPGAIRDGIPS